MNLENTIDFIGNYGIYKGYSYDFRLKDLDDDGLDMNTDSFSMTITDADGVEHTFTETKNITNNESTLGFTKSETALMAAGKSTGDLVINNDKLVQRFNIYIYE